MATKLQDLVGGVIEEVDVVDHPDFRGDPIAVLLVRTKKGSLLQVEAWRDPEGNGAGHLSIGPVVRGKG